MTIDSDFVSTVIALLLEQDRATVEDLVAAVSW